MMMCLRTALMALSVVALMQTGAMAEPAAAPVTVTLTNFAFTPNTITLKSGTMYTLHLVNNGSSGHDFSAPEFFAASTVASADKSKLEDGGVDLDSGQSVNVTVTPTKAGTYKLECTHFMHAMFGMTGKIIVE